MTDELFIGLQPGTGRDGVDAVLINFSNASMDLLHARRTPYPAAIRRMLEQLPESGQAPVDLASLLDDSLGRFFARCAQDLVREVGMEMRDIRAIGCHGRRVRSGPGAGSPLGRQPGKGGLIAKNTGVAVVTDFQSADVAAGGRGAPLAPLLHQKLFYSQHEDRAIVSIGGIASLTLLPASGGMSGFDCGPGMCLMDAWTMRHLQKPCDEAGRWASKGHVNHGLLQRMLQDHYFDLPPPKSTGLEYFNMGWLENILAEHVIGAADLQATLAELTALAIARSLAGGPLPRRLLVCGCGARNTYLLGRLAAALPDVVVDRTARYGADPDWIEALLSAWLARERLAGRLQNTAPISGASQPVLLGDIFEP